MTGPSPLIWQSDRLGPSALFANPEGPIAAWQIRFVMGGFTLQAVKRPGFNLADYFTLDDNAGFVESDAATSPCISESVFLHLSRNQSRLVKERLPEIPFEAHRLPIHSLGFFELPDLIERGLVTAKVAKAMADYMSESLNVPVTVDDIGFADSEATHVARLEKLNLLDKSERSGHAH